MTALTFSPAGLSIPALAALAEQTRNAVGWECYSRPVRAELQQLADMLDTALSERRMAFSSQMLDSLRNWRSEVRDCLRQGRRLAVEDIGFLSDLGMQRHPPNAVQFRRLTRIMARVTKLGGCS